MQKNLTEKISFFWQEKFIGAFFDSLVKSCYTRDMDETQKNIYRKKREVLAELLAELQPHWVLAEGFEALITSQYVTPEIIDALEKLLREALTTAKDTIAQAKIENTLRTLETYRALEAEERDRERRSAEILSLNY